MSRNIFLLDWLVKPLILCITLSTVVIAQGVPDAQGDEEQTTGNAGLDEGLEQIEKAAEKKARARAIREAIEKYGNDTIKKYAGKVPGLAGKTNPVSVFLQTLFASSPAGEGSDVVPSREELEAQGYLTSQTTGLASPLGNARTQRDAEELRQVLATTPDGPFVATVESPSGTSTGGFSGEEGLNIAGVLNVFAFDSGQLQDGDRVRLTVRDSRGVVFNQTITLTFGGRTSRVSTTRGLVNVTITALNEGTDPPNTGGLRVSGDVAGNRNGNFDLNVGQSGTLAVRVLGN